MRISYGGRYVSRTKGDAFATGDEAPYQAKDNGRRQVWLASKIPAPPMLASRPEQRKAAA